MQQTEAKDFQLLYPNKRTTTTPNEMSIHHGSINEQ